jgi:hypothetical protein
VVDVGIEVAGVGVEVVFGGPAVVALNLVRKKGLSLKLAK